jgi:hypothetical protein
MKHDLRNLAVMAEVTEDATNNGATANPYPEKPNTLHLSDENQSVNDGHGKSHWFSDPYTM